MSNKSFSTVAFELGKTVGKAEGINECGRLLLRYIPVELRGMAAVEVMHAALAVAAEAERDTEGAVTQ